MTTDPLASPKAGRLDSVDLLRGVIVVIMALDHTRDFFGAIGADPTDLTTASTALFLTRWVTNICAPVFFLLTGTGAWFSGQRRGQRELAHHLFTRGLWLVILEVTALRFAMQFNLDYKVTILTVLWAIGWSMMGLAVLVRLPVKVIAAFGAVLVLGHNLLDGVSAESFGTFAPLWNFLHAPGFLINTPDHQVLVAYTFLPWVGVTALGYALGALFDRPQAERVRLLHRLCIVAIAAFVALRLVNVYGDPRPWTPGDTGLLTLLSFLNTVKYPPSLLFLLMTLGPALCLLAWFEGGIPKWLRWALPYGKTPLFFFLLHFFLIHLLAVLAAAVRFGEIGEMFESPSLDRFPITAPPGWDLGLPFVYLVWIAVVAALYPACRWYARLRATGRYPWLSYL